MKKAIIIGASSGIGKELAKQLSYNNYKVGITGRKEELLYELKKSKSNSFLIKAFDATDVKISIEKLEELTKELGGLDLLIFSSGTGELNKKLDFEIERKVIDLNVIGFTNIIDWAFNYFEKQKCGHLVAITSLAGLRGGYEAPSYNATKSYQINYLEGLGQKSIKSELPIFISDIRPGLVDTDMAKGDKLFWVMPVEKVAKQIFKAINKKRKVVYVTKRWGIIARILKVLPRFIYINI
jgi:short-subunit dehydrogenase